MKEKNFIEEYKKNKDEASTKNGKSEKSFVKKFKKSYDYRNHGVAISTTDQYNAETTADPQLLLTLREKTRDLKDSDIVTCDLGKGQLTLAKKDQNLFNGYFKDQDGQIVEKFDDKTIELVAKTLMVKNLILTDEPDVQEVMAAVEPVKEPEAKTYVRIKFGDFELEMKKSLEAALVNRSDRDTLKKSLKIFRKSTASYTNLTDDKETIREILENWNIHSERFNQILFAVDQVKKAKK